MLPGFVYLREKLSGGNLSHIMTRDADTGKGGVDNASLRDIVEAYNCHLLRHLVASETQGLDGSDCNQVIVRKITVCQSISLSLIHILTTMNRVILMGRLTKNPEINYAGKDRCV